MKKALKDTLKKIGKSYKHISYLLKSLINNPYHNIRYDFQKFFRKNGLNICFNQYIPKDYNKKYKNILIAIESPAVVEYNKWINNDMEFIAEISFGNFLNLENYYCPRELYSTNDFYVNLDPHKKFHKKKLISIIYSSQKKLEGHKLRHKVVEKYKDQIDVFGGPELSCPLEKISKDCFYPNSKYIRKEFSLNEYMFQIVIENGKYPDYVSEKFFDCLKCRTIPIYWGGESSVKIMGFNPEGILFFNNLNDLEKILNEKISEEIYKSKIKAINFNFKKLIEIRNKQRYNYFLSSVLGGYFHSPESYHCKNYNKMSLDFF
ncbi:MAG: glycosyltransferase family 10 domain-containing protein [Candidatus Helarchaeota archaeon]